MLERHETFVGEMYRRELERRYAEVYRTAKQNGLPVSYYRRTAYQVLTSLGQSLIELGKQYQSPIENGYKTSAMQTK